MASALTRTKHYRSTDISLSHSNANPINEFLKKKKRRRRRRRYHLSVRIVCKGYSSRTVASIRGMDGLIFPSKKLTSSYTQNMEGNIVVVFRFREKRMKSVLRLVITIVDEMLLLRSLQKWI